MAFPACQAAAWRVTGRSDGPWTVGLVKGLPLYKLDLHVLLWQQLGPFFPVDINSLFYELDFEFFHEILHAC